MEYRKKSTRKMLAGVLKSHGMTIQEFADRHGFRVNTVTSVMHRHWGKDTKPKGDVAREILETMESYFEKPPTFMASGRESAECREAC